MSCNKKLKDLKDKIDESIEQQEADFDIKNIIVELKKNTYFRNHFSKNTQASQEKSENKLKKIEEQLIVEKFEELMITNN